VPAKVVRELIDGIVCEAVVIVVIARGIVISCFVCKD
jgi:hypothetical protein